jgi:anti-anti-sigma factor
MHHLSDRRRRRSRRRPIAPRRGARPARRQPATPEPLRISEEHHGTVAIVHVSGEFDLVAVDPVERALDRSVDPLTDHVIFDLRRVSFLDLSGLQTMITADARARRESFAVHVVPPPGLAARIFTLTEPGRALALLDDLPRDS